MSHHPAHAGDHRTPPAMPAIPEIMRAVTRQAYGGVEQVQVQSVARPEPGVGQVLLAVRAAGLDRGVLHLLTGTPYLARPAFGLRRPRQPVLGREVAGQVVALGPGVTGLAVGDRVFGAGEGTFAEYAAARVERLVPIPDGVTDEQAATLPVSAGTALLAVRTHARVEAGQRVLVLGASGAVGSFVVQVAAHLGAEVTGVCSAGKADFVRGLGAARVADYRTTSLGELPGPFDAIIDIAGNRPLAALRDVLTPAGALVIVGGEKGGPWFGGLHRNIGASLLNPLVSQRLGWFVSIETTELFTQLADLVATGAMRPALDRTVGLDGAADALADMAAGRLQGKVVVRPA